MIAYDDVGVALKLVRQVRIPHDNERHRARIR